MDNFWSREIGQSGAATETGTETEEGGTATWDIWGWLFPREEKEEDTSAEDEFFWNNIDNGIYKV